MCGLTESSALILAAIIAFIGVTITAIMSYSSNYRINNKKIKHEEKKLKQAFLRESFDNLRNASKELHIIKIDYSDVKKAHMDLAELIIKSKDVFNAIKPFFPKEKRDMLEEGRYKTFDIDYKGCPTELFEQRIKFRNDLERAVDEEILLLSDKLREFNM